MTAAHLTRAMASQFARLALAGIDREYPWSPAGVVTGAEDLVGPRARHPAFFGCYDWHSAVHAHWLLVRLLRVAGEMGEAAAARAVLNDHLTDEHLRKEAAFFARPSARSFERMYGWAWLLKLAEELHVFGAAGDAGARAWSRALAPLVGVIVQRYFDFLPRHTYPIRRGVHHNTAFGLGFAHSYADAVSDSALKELVAERSRHYFEGDVAAPAAWEPDGADFLSPCLQEAELMRLVLAPAAFRAWLARFLPGLPRGEPASLLLPASVSDRTDPQIVHLDGLNLSRAWCMRRLAAALAPGEAAREALLRAADAHAAAGLAHVASGDYVGEHWLASFAVLLLT